MELAEPLHYSRTQHDSHPAHAVTTSCPLLLSSESTFVRGILIALKGGSMYEDEAFFVWGICIATPPVSYDIQYISHSLTDSLTH